MKKRPGSYIVFYRDSKVLLIYRPTGYSNSLGYIGDGIEDGETPEEALVREVKEELGYDLKKDEYKLVTSKTFIVKKNEEEYEVETFMYISELKDKLDKFILTDKDEETGEFCTLKLIDLEDIDSLDIRESGRELLKEIKEYIENKIL